VEDAARLTDAPVEGLVFDLDGVLTDTAEQHYQAWKRLAERHGLVFDRERNEGLRGVSRAESLRLLLDGVHVDEATFERMLADKNADYVRALDGLGPDDVLPGAHRVLEDARSRGWRLAVASSSRNARTVLDRLGLTSAFEALVDGTAGLPAKPAPDLFLQAAEELGLAPAGCVVIEDAASGVAAAIAAGMRVVGVGPVQRVGDADLVVDGLDSLDLDAVASLPVRDR
jgi:beta-phosphoglucomutase